MFHIITSCLAEVVIRFKSFEVWLWCRVRPVRWKDRTFGDVRAVMVLLGELASYDVPATDRQAVKANFHPLHQYVYL